MHGFARRASITIITLLIIAVVAGCGSAKVQDGSDINISKDEVQQVELMYFHPRIRCVSCNDIETYAREVSEGDFANQMSDGKLKFEALQIEDGGNKALVDELDVGGSSLYLIVSGGGKRSHEQIKDVWLYWDKPEQAKEIIRDELSRYL